MPLREMVMEWYWSAFVGLLTLLGGAVGHRLVSNWLKLQGGTLDLRERERAGTEAEWQRVSDRQQLEIKELKEKDHDKEKQIAELQAENMKCFREHAESRAEMKIMKHQIDQLQKMSLNAVISTTATVTADETGTIMDADDAIRDILGYRPLELKGENVDLIIPRRIRSQYHAGLEKARLSGAVRPIDIAIQTFALTKDRREIPVIVSLNSWRDERGEKFISAQIIHRRIFESVVQVNPNDGSDVHTALGSNSGRVEGGSGQLKSV